MLRKITSLLALLALSISGLVATPTIASAAGGSSDATLSNLQVITNTGNGWFLTGGTRISPSFSAEQTYYNAYSAFTAVDFTATATDSGASVKITGGDVTNAPMAAGVANTLNFEAKAENLVTVKVTAADGIATKTYTVNMSNVVMPQPKLVYLAPAKFSTGGGDYGVAYVKNVFREGCSTSFRYSYEYLNGRGEVRTENAYLSNSISAPDANGISTVGLDGDGLYNAFRKDSTLADLRIESYCQISDPQTGQWKGATSLTVEPDAISFFNPSVTSVKLPETISHYSLIKVSGPGMNSDGFFESYLLNPATGNRIYFNDRRINNDSMLLYMSGWERSEEWLTAKNVKFVVQQYDYNDDDNVVVLYTKDVKYSPIVPTRVSMSPAKGSVLGGNTVKMTGHFICSGNWGFSPVITVGGRLATNVISNSCASESSSTGDQYDGLDQLSFTVPSGSAGNADVTIDIGFGPFKISQKYVYGDKPTVSSITPSTVSRTGGSMITINGDNFGLAGTPIVTIGGQKSPYVLRVSQTKVLAMVPASATSGAVEVNIISSSGGGALDLPATITLAAASSNPTIKVVTPAKSSTSGGDVVTITGTGFSTVASGVTFGGVPAKITAVTATSISVEVPAADAAGSVAVAVGTPTGLATRASAFTYTAPAGVQSVSPAAVASYLTGNAAKVTITGAGFGAKGTVTVGSAKPIAYTSTGSGARISDVAIPTTKVGSISISILPSGAKVPFTTSVRVTGPVISYVGPNPYNSEFADYNPFTQDDGGSMTAASNPAGGQVLRIQGTGFGTAGKVKFGNTLVTPTSYTDTAIVFTTPAATGTSVDIQVVPNSGTLTATRKAGVLIGFVLAGPEITKIHSSVDNARGGDRHTFAPAEDISDLFVITGSGFLSSDNGVKTVVEMVNLDGENWVTITPQSVSNTQITFRAPRTLEVPKWASVRVVTKTDSVSQNLGIFYVGVAPQPTTMSPSAGICTKEAQGIYIPGVVTATGAGVFGSAGTVKLGGETISASAVTWSDNEVVVDFSAQAANISSPWGRKEISFVPADATKPVLNFSYNCGVSTDVTTKLNGSVSALTIPAGTSYTATATMNNPVPGTTYVQPADGYLYQSVEDYNADALRRNVKSGLPVAAGDWYIWANTGVATFDRDKYGFVGNQNQMRLTISGAPVTFTPKLVTGTGTSIVYRGQLGDGTNGSPNDIGYTKSTTADAVTEVTWQHRNHKCATSDPNTGWNSGLPNAVAIEWSWCGGDDTTATSWEIRVSGFKMVSGNVDKAILYLPTYNVFELTVTKKDLTISSSKAEKVYDGSTVLPSGGLTFTFTGAIPADSVNLDWNFVNGAAFADANVGTSKPITLNGQASLDWGWRNLYNLTNPSIQITGTIKKADAILKLTSNPGSVVMGNNTAIALTVETLDSRTNQPIDVAAGAATPVLVNKTTSVCTLNGTNVTALKAGDCIIEATQAASTNYNAAKSFKDDSTGVEELVIKVYSAPKVVSVIADDLVVPTGDPIIPSYSMAGLIDGDTYENVEFDYYQGTTLLTSAPTTIGTYKIVPKLGSLTAFDSAAYNNVIKYVAGKLVITALPPEISAVSPDHGPEAGGNTVVISGTGFATVTSIKVGELTIRKPNFVVNGDGTTLSFKMPKGKGATTITLLAGPAEATADYTYDPPAVGPVTGPISLKLTLKLEIGAKFSGQTATLKGSGLKANSDYSLMITPKSVLVVKGKTDSNGAFSRVIKLPASACAAEGKYALTLTGLNPAGKNVTDMAYFFISGECEIVAQATKTTSKSWTLNGFSFGYNQPTLNAGGVSSLKALATLLKGAKTVTIYGYTETDTKSEAVKRANIILAQGRTDSVAAFLKSLGIKAVYKTVAKGGVEPVSLTDQSKNRRVVITATF